MQQQVVFGIGPLAVVSVVLVIGLLVAVFSSRSWLGALAALFGLLLLAVVLGGSLLIFRVARSGVGVVGMPPLPQDPPVPSVPSVPSVPRVPSVPPVPSVPGVPSVPPVAPTMRIESPRMVVAEALEPIDAERATTNAAAPPTEPATPPAASADAGEGHTLSELPGWVTAGEGRVDGVFRMPISIGPFPSYEDCGPEKPKAYANAVKRYANEYLQEGAGDYVDLPMWYINQNIYRSEAKEFRESPTLGKVVTVHYLLEFNDAVRQHIVQVYHQALVAERLKYAGLGAAGIFGLLATAFGYLKLDTLSRGYYTGRLRAAAAVAILGLVVGLLFVA